MCVAAPFLLLSTFLICLRFFLLSGCVCVCVCVYSPQDGRHEKERVTEKKSTGCVSPYYSMFFFFFWLLHRFLPLTIIIIISIIITCIFEILLTTTKKKSKREK